MDGSTAITITSILSAITEIFTASVGWLGMVAETVASNPLLLFTGVIGFVGLGVGLYKRLLHV